jgi:hypothetical protein
MPKVLSDCEDHHRHPGESRGPGNMKETWIQTSAGMTDKKAEMVGFPNFCLRGAKRTLFLAIAIYVVPAGLQEGTWEG